MSMSTFVVGIKPPDEKWKKMKAVYDSCIEADTPIPNEVDKFFGEEIPDEKGVVVYLGGGCEDNKCCTTYSTEGGSGYEIDLSKLPKDIKILRFVNSW